MKRTFSPQMAAIALLLMAFNPAWAHYSWIHPLTPIAKPGESVTIQLSTGHAFPESEQAPSRQYLKIWANTPSGKQLALEATEKSNCLQVSYLIGEAGRHIVVCESDRGIISRTPTGWQPGGLDQFPDAKSSMNFYGSALAQITTPEIPGIQSDPVGLKFELTFRLKSDQITLTVFQNLKPFEGASIILVSAGAEKAIEMGITDANGQLTYSVASLKGPVIFTARYEKKAPENANYQRDFLSSTLYLNLD